MARQRAARPQGVSIGRKTRVAESGYKAQRAHWSIAHLGEPASATSATARKELGDRPSFSFATPSESDAFLLTAAADTVKAARASKCKPHPEVMEKITKKADPACSFRRCHVTRHVRERRRRHGVGVDETKYATYPPSVRHQHSPAERVTGRRVRSDLPLKRSGCTLPDQSKWLTAGRLAGFGPVPPVNRSYSQNFRHNGKIHFCNFLNV